MTPSAAETVALQALGWIAEQEDLLGVFLGATGASLTDVKERAGDAEFLASVLDFLLMDDAWVVGFCDTAGLGYDRVMRARAVLPGGMQVNWT